MDSGERDKPVRPLSAPTVDLHGVPALPPATPAPGRGSPFDRGADRFEVRGELGRGGMGRVEDAFDRTLGRPVAIKHVLRESELEVARFEREARITARLEHPGIVPLYEAGRGPDGTPYYVMRRVDGRPLDQLVAAASFAERLALVPNLLTAAEAVAYAHARGIVHRDLKPTNILVGGFGETLVIDWGLAREIAPDAAASGSRFAAVGVLTAAGGVAGTPGFMAPEQARGEPLDAAADVFALGATLFFVLAGRAPYTSETPTLMIEAASAGEPPDWSALPAGVPADLRALLGKALAADPARRYGDAGALAADLRRFITGNLVDAHRYGALARLGRFARRHRAVLAVIAASALVLAIAGALAVRRVVVERDAADEARALAELRQRQAAASADQMLVQRAQQLAATDPVGAVALLRRLDAGSARWREAWLAATAAWQHGIPFGFHGDPDMFWVQLAGDGRHAITTSLGGRVVAYDLVARTRRAVATLDHVLTCQWIGPHHVLCNRSDGNATIVDTEVGTLRELAVQARVVVGDRRSRVVIETDDHRIVEVVGPDGEPATIATDATLAAAALDLGTLALWHGDALALWTAAGTREVVRVFDHRSSLVELRDRTLVAALGDQVVRWRIDPDRVVEVARWSRPAELSRILLDRDRVYAVDRAEVHALDAPIRIAGMSAASVFATDGGFGVLESDGAVSLFDHDGRLRLGPYTTRLVRADVSPDGRFLVAVTSSDEVLAWDLGELRAQRLPLEATEQPVMLTPPYLWSLDSTRGLVRRELGHGDGEVVLPGTAFGKGSWVHVADDGSWSAFRDPATGKLAAYDVAAKVRSPLASAITQAIEPEGLVVARADGVIGTWRPGASHHVVELARLPSGVTDLAVGGPYLIARLTSGTLARFDRKGAARGTADVVEAVHDIAIERSGRAWIVTEHGGLWSWDPDAPAVRVVLAEKVDALWTAGGRILAHAPHSLIALDLESPRAITAELRAATWMGGDYLACMSPHGDVSVLDLATGGSVALGAVAAGPTIVASGDTIGFSRDTGDASTRLQIITLHVPHDPPALRRWLQDVTNARQDGDGMAWP